MTDTIFFGNKIHINEGLKRIGISYYVKYNINTLIVFGCQYAIYILPIQ